MNYDLDVIRVIESSGASFEGGVVEFPLRRSDLPDEFGKLAPVFFVTCQPAFGRKIILVPPLQLSPRGQRIFVGFLAANQITTHRNHRLAALWAKRRDNVCRTRSPVKTGENRLLDL